MHARLVRRSACECWEELRAALLDDRQIAGRGSTLWMWCGRLAPVGDPSQEPECPLADGLGAEQSCAHGGDNHGNFKGRKRHGEQGMEDACGTRRKQNAGSRLLQGGLVSCATAPSLRDALSDHAGGLPIAPVPGQVRFRDFAIDPRFDGSGKRLIEILLDTSGTRLICKPGSSFLGTCI